MADVTTLQALRDAANAAIASGDYATAQTNLEQAQVMLATMPDTEMEGKSMRWYRESIVTALTQINRQRQASGGIQRTKITYVNATD